MRRRINRVTLCGAGLAGLLTAVSHAHAQAELSFSGSEGDNFTVTLAEPVTYTIDANYGHDGPTQAPTFVFQGVGNDFTGGGSAANGTITYSFDGGPPNPIDGMYSGQSVKSLTPDDAYIWGNNEGVSVGETVTLSAGTLMTYGGSLPANGSYTTVIMDSYGNIISTDGVLSVPEPGSLGVLGLGAFAIIGRRGRRAV